MSNTSLSLLLVGIITFIIMAVLVCHIINIATKDELRENNIGKNPNNN